MKRTLVIAALTTAACQDNEQRARAIGATARDAVTCAPEDEGCTDQACRKACAGTDVPKGFDDTCRDTCRQTAICATDADCGPGHQCIAIAPVVRRCGTSP